jgi:chromate transport protein ChrA
MNDRHLDGTRMLWLLAAGFLAVLGGAMLIGGLGLAFAISTSAQPPLQFATAGVLILTGAVNLWASPQLWKRKRRARTASALATAMLIAYLGIIGDVGEPLLLHALYLALLAGLVYRGRSAMRPKIHGEVGCGP